MDNWAILHPFIPHFCSYKRQIVNFRLRESWIYPSQCPFPDPLARDSLFSNFYKHFISARSFMTKKKKENTVELEELFEFVRINLVGVVTSQGQVLPSTFPPMKRKIFMLYL